MNDLRYKLSDNDRKQIRILWNAGLNNYTVLGIKFGVHPKTIKKVVDENYRLLCNKFNRENWKRYKPSKEHHTELMRKYRKRKKLLKNA